MRPTLARRAFQRCKQASKKIVVARPVPVGEGALVDIERGPFDRTELGRLGRHERRRLTREGHFLGPAGALHEHDRMGAGARTAWSTWQRRSPRAGSKLRQTAPNIDPSLRAKPNLEPFGFGVHAGNLGHVRE
jgi:hypothetical protein